jgi:hypothetical protein
VVAVTDLENGVESNVYVRGAFSRVANFTTEAPTRPGKPPMPELTYSTGGALGVKVSWPNDTGTRAYRLHEHV